MLALGRQIANGWQVITEYQSPRSRHDAVPQDSGWLKSDVVTHALNPGIDWRFQVAWTLPPRRA